MRKNASPHALGDTFPVMKEMKEKNLHRAPRAPGPWGLGAGCNRWGRAPDENFCILSTFRKMKEKSIICFIRTVAV